MGENPLAGQPDAGAVDSGNDAGQVGAPDANAPDSVAPDAGVIPPPPPAHDAGPPACVRTGREAACGSHDCGSAPDGCGGAYACGEQGGGCGPSPYQVCGLATPGMCFRCQPSTSFSCAGQSNYTMYPYQCPYAEDSSGAMIVPLECKRYAAPFVNGTEVAEACCY